MTTEVDRDRTTTGAAPSRLSDDERARLAELATQFRVRSIEMADRAGSGHPTSSMSAADLVAVLTARHLRLDPARPDALGNDRIVFSKGHASPLLYAALEAMGVLDDRRDGFDDVVDAYRQRGSILEGHPTPRVPGVPAATGSLGLGLAVGAGLAIAHRLARVSDAHVWVLCGDGELAEGAVWEAVEHAGSTPLQGLTAIVDVNRLGQTGVTRHGWDVDAYQRRFDGFGWATEVVDGHDLDAIDAALAASRGRAVPTAVIARTEKGRGASETADEQGKHGKPLDDPDEAIQELGGRRSPVRCTPRAADLVGGPAGVTDGEPDLPTWEVGDEVPTRDAFGEAMVALGRWRDDVVALDGEVKNSTRLAGFAEAFPGRFVQAYIAEQLMTGAAIGLDASGWRPVMATFGAFLTRAHDVLRMATISRSDLLVVGSHAGISIGEDGPSQMALEDLAMMRCLAESTVVSPSDANQTAALLAQLVDRRGISYLRTMRGATPVIHDASTPFPIGGSVLLRPSDDPEVTVMATGVTVHEALDAVDRLAERGMAAQVLDVYSLKPVDREGIAAAAGRSDRVVVVEDHRPEGGLGDAVRAVLAESDGDVTVTHLAVDDVPGSASPAEQRADAGIDAEAIVRAAVGES
jgi:transketolase